MEWSPTGVAALISAMGVLITGLLTLLFTKGTDSRVKIIQAESKAEALRNTQELLTKNTLIDSLSSRVNKLESIIETIRAEHIAALQKFQCDHEKQLQELRQRHHDERNRWNQDHLNCIKESAELRGEVKILRAQIESLSQSVSKELQKPAPATTPVTIENKDPVLVHLDKGKQG